MSAAKPRHFLTDDGTACGAEPVGLVANVTSLWERTTCDDCKAKRPSTAYPIKGQQRIDWPSATPTGASQVTKDGFIHMDDGIDDSGRTQARVDAAITSVSDAFHSLSSALACAKDVDRTGAPK